MWVGGKPAQTHAGLESSSRIFVRRSSFIQTRSFESTAAAVGAGALQQFVRRYVKPALLIREEVGDLPIDRLGADLHFKVISQRYERDSVVGTITSALLERLRPLRPRARVGLLRPAREFDEIPVNSVGEFMYAKIDVSI